LSRWISVDPVLNSYLDGKKGLGGVYNSVNLYLYHYAGNNPIKYNDPTGKNLGVATNSKGALGAGHMALYIVSKDKNGKDQFDFFEIGSKSNAQKGGSPNDQRGALLSNGSIAGININDL